jgi:hypothetical protein
MLGEPVDRSTSGEDATYSGLRVVRTVAMLSIVGFHVSWQPLLGIAFGLTSLQVVMCALVVRSRQPSTLRPFAAKRAKRLLTPWIFWSGAYALFEIGRNLLRGTPPLSTFQGWMLGCGASPHLWFLPFAFAASLLVNRAHALARGWSNEASVVGSAMLGVAALLAAEPLKAQLVPISPFDLWIDGIPSLAFGFSIGRALSLPSAPRRSRGLLAVALASLLPWVLEELAPIPTPLFLRYAVAVPVACAGFAVRVPRCRTLELLASFNLGVYLVHMLAIQAVNAWSGAADLTPLAHTLAVYAACLPAVWVLRRLGIPNVT